MKFHYALSPRSRAGGSPQALVLSARLTSEKRVT